VTDHWDMEHPRVDITPNKAAGIIIHISRMIGDKVEEFEKLNEAAAQAKKTAEVCFAEAYLGAAPRPLEERRQIAMLAAADARFDADVADRLVKACSKALDKLHADMDSARTISATARDEMKSLGGQP
jgi:hypothetical protein